MGAGPSRQDISHPFGLQVQKGLITAHSHVHKFGFSNLISSTRSTCISQGGNISYLTSAETMNVNSSGVDNSTGTGGRKCIVKGLDGNYNEVQEEVTLNGSTVTTSQAFIRVYDVYLTEAGSGGTNANVVGVVASSAGTTQAEIPAGYGQAQMAVYTVPAGYTLYLREAELSVGKTDSIEVTLEKRLPGTGAWRVIQSHIISQNQFRIVLDFSESVPAKTDLRVRGQRLTGSGDQSLAVSFDSVLVGS